MKAFAFFLKDRGQVLSYPEKPLMNINVTTMVEIANYGKIKSLWLKLIFCYPHSYSLGKSARTADPFYLVHLSCPVPGLSRCPSYLLPSCSRFPTLILRSLPLFLGVYEVYSQSPWQLLARPQSELRPEWRQSPWRRAGGKSCPPGLGGLGALGCFPGSSCGSNLNPLSSQTSLPSAIGPLLASVLWHSCWDKRKFSFWPF